jgi:hypothetical protein
MTTNVTATNLRTLKSSELVTLYNTAATKLGVRTVTKFSDKETAISRTRAIMAKVGTEVTAEEVRRVSSFPPPPALPVVEAANSPVDAASEPAGEIALRKARTSVAPAAPKGERLPKAPKGTVRKTTPPPAAGPMDNLPKLNRMSFNFKPLSSAAPPKGSASSLRALCFARMSKVPCTYQDIVDLIKGFDAGRGKGNANTIDRRAYELIRLMHYALGYGIKHDEVTGLISLYTK